MRDLMSSPLDLGHETSILTGRLSAWCRGLFLACPCVWPLLISASLMISQLPPPTLHRSLIQSKNTPVPAAVGKGRLGEMQMRGIVGRTLLGSFLCHRADGSNQSALFLWPGTENM